jgi:starch synthase
VRATGGLADTVINLDELTLKDGTATGFTFNEATPKALWDAISRTLGIWPRRDVWAQLVRNGMEADWSWDHSAKEYVKIYEEIIRRVQARPAQSILRQTAAGT